MAICWLIPPCGFSGAVAGDGTADAANNSWRDGDFRDADVAVVFSEGEPEVPGTTATRFSPAPARRVQPRLLPGARTSILPQAMLAGALHTDQSGWQALAGGRGLRPSNPRRAGVSGLQPAARGAWRAKGLHLPAAIIRDDLASGRLVRLSQRTVMDGHDARGARSAAGSAAGAAFRDWLIATAATHRHRSSSGGTHRSPG